MNDTGLTVPGTPSTSSRIKLSGLDYLIRKGSLGIALYFVLGLKDLVMKYLWGTCKQQSVKRKTDSGPGRNFVSQE